MCGPTSCCALLPPQAQRWVEMFNCLVAIAFCGGMVWYGWRDRRHRAGCSIERSSTDLQFPMWIYYAALPVGGVLMLVRYLIRLFRYLFRFDPRDHDGRPRHRARGAGRPGRCRPTDASDRAPMWTVAVPADVLRPARRGHADLPGAGHLRRDPVLRLRPAADRRGADRDRPAQLAPR